MRRLALTSLAALCAAAATAGAAVERTGEPATVVRADALRLVAQDAAGGGLCLDLLGGALARRDATCPAPRPLAPRTSRGGGRTAFYGTSSSRAARVDLLLSDGRRPRVRTRAGTTYRGAQAGTVRFFARALRGRPAVGGVQERDGAGRVIAAADLNPLALPPLRGRASLARLRDERGRRALLAAIDTRVVAAGGSGWRRRALCVGLRPRARLAGARSVCATRDAQLRLSFGAICPRGRAIVYGAVPAAVGRAVAIDREGARHRVRLLEVPRRLGHRSRAVLAGYDGAPPAEVVAHDGRGRELARVRMSGSC